MSFERDEPRQAARFVVRPKVMQQEREVYPIGRHRRWVGGRVASRHIAGELGLICAGIVSLRRVFGALDFGFVGVFRPSPCNFCFQTQK